MQAKVIKKKIDEDSAILSQSASLKEE